MWAFAKCIDAILNWTELKVNCIVCAAVQEASSTEATECTAVGDIALVCFYRDCCRPATFLPPCWQPQAIYATHQRCVSVILASQSCGMTLAHLRCGIVIPAHQRCVGVILAHQRWVGMILAHQRCVGMILVHQRCVDMILAHLPSPVCGGRSDCVWTSLFFCLWGQIWLSEPLPSFIFDPLFTFVCVCMDRAEDGSGTDHPHGPLRAGGGAEQGVGAAQLQPLPGLGLCWPQPQGWALRVREGPSCFSSYLSYFPSYRYCVALI